MAALPPSAEVVLLKFEGEVVVDFPSVEGEDLHVEGEDLHVEVEDLHEGVVVHEGEGLHEGEEDLPVEGGHEVVVLEGAVDPYAWEQSLEEGEVVDESLEVAVDEAEACGEEAASEQIPLDVVGEESDEVGPYEAGPSVAWEEPSVEASSASFLSNM